MTGRGGGPTRIRLPRGVAMSPADAMAVGRRIESLSRARFAARLERPDPALWSKHPQVRRTIARRLGWIRSPSRFLEEVGRLESFARQARDQGIRRVVLLGMGGSSLGPEVLRTVFGTPGGGPALTVLDTTVPAAVERAAVAGPLDSTLFLVSSKSGTTVETNALLAHFWGRLRRLRGPETGRQFVAITDPGTPLSEIAATRGFRAVFHNPDDIGGRYSVLSYFGLVPAALIGIDLKVFLGRAAAMAAACGAGPGPRHNPGLSLGAALGELGRRGRDKIVLAIDRPIEPYGLWVEQLVAESTGKDGRGLIPVVETLSVPDLEGLGGPDRVIVPIALVQGGATRDLEGMIARNPEGLPDGTPILPLTLAERNDLGASMFQWMMATAVAGSVLGVNPFDEPDVSEAKATTEAVLKECAVRGRLPEERADAEEGRARLFLARSARVARPARSGRTVAGPIRDLLASGRRGDYIALLVYADPGEDLLRRAVERARARLGALTGLPATAGFGPRYLHSTGQIHKGGPNTGLFLQVVPNDPAVLPIPGRPYDLETLKQAQALGDHLTLDRRGRRALRIRFGGSALSALGLLIETLDALPPVPAGAAAPRRPPRRRARR